MDHYSDPFYVDYDSEEEKRQQKEDRLLVKLQTEYLKEKLEIIKDKPQTFDLWSRENRDDLNFLWDQLRRLRIDLFSKLSMYTFTKLAWKFSDSVKLSSGKVTKDDIHRVAKERQNIALVRVRGTVDDYHEWCSYNKYDLRYLYQRLTGYRSDLFSSMSYGEFCLLGWKYSS